MILVVAVVVEYVYIYTHDLKCNSFNKGEKGKFPLITENSWQKSFSDNFK